MKILCFLLCVQGHPADIKGGPGAPTDPTLGAPTDWDSDYETSTSTFNPETTSFRQLDSFELPLAGNVSENDQQAETTENLPPPTLKNNISYLTRPESQDSIKQTFDLPKTNNDLFENAGNAEKNPPNFELGSPRVFSRRLGISESLSQVNTVPDLTFSENSCSVPGKCLDPAPENIKCFGTNLGYKQSSLLLSGLPNQSELKFELEEWETLRQVPGCWKVIQPLLCGIYYPRCSNDTVQLLPVDVCKVVRSPCRILTKLNPKWEKIINCDSFRYSDCKKDEKSERLRFNTTALCPYPLIPTQDSNSYFGEIDECALSCQSPILTQEQYTRIRTFIGIAGTICLVSTLFAISTFLIDWVGANKYPAVAIFYINICCFLTTLGWLAQLGAKDDIVCRKDGVLRLAEPGSGENLSCVVVFILVYYFSLAGGVWLIILTYTWAVFFTCNSKVKDLIEPKTAYFHMAAWSFPAVLTIIIMAMNQVEASSIYGICYIGYETISTRIIFLILPYSIFLLISGYYSVRCLIFLCGVYLTPDFLSERESAKVQSTLFRIGSFSVLTGVCILASFLCQIYEFLNKDIWNSSLQDLVLCNIKNQDISVLPGSPAVDKECKMADSPNQTILEVQLLCMFGAGILSSSWVYTKESLNSWRIFFHQLCTRQKSQRPLRLKKHEMIAQAFSKRRELQDHGRLSLTLQSAHVDPLGMNLELGEESSGEISSNWAAALPYLVQRRGGRCGAEQLGLGRRNSQESLNSNFSQSVSIAASVQSSRFGWWDRKQSGDTQSIQRSDLDRLQSIYDDSVRKTKRKSKRDFFKSHAMKVRPWSRLSRRGSTGSRRDSSYTRNSESSMNSQILPAITLDPAKLVGKHRRSEYSLPEPGKSTDFGKRPAVGPDPGDPVYRELEEKLFKLAHNSRDGSLLVKSAGGDGDLATGDGGEPATISRSIQTSLTDLSKIGQRVYTTSTGTQMTPETRRIKPVSTATTTTETSTDLSSTPLHHIEANIVNVKVVAPSSEDSSIPSSYEKDFKMKKFSSRGKENIEIIPPPSPIPDVETDLNLHDIPALKQLSLGPLIRPREHYRGRRGAIVEKLSPKGGIEEGDTTSS